VVTRVPRAITTIDAWIHIPLLLEGSELVDLMVIYLIFTSRLAVTPTALKERDLDFQSFGFLFLSLSLSLSLSLYCNFLSYSISFLA
jgi:hypothetical protein